MLQVEGAVVRYGEHVALAGIDLDVGPHETVALLGPSGSGKTTLLRAIAGLQPLDAGTVRFDGRDLRRVAAHQRRFGLMFQEYALFPHRDLAGNVELGLRMARVPAAERAQRVDDVLALVGLRELRARRVGSLSGGEQQRAALARALAVSPRLLMLDEPLGALDRVWRTQLLGDIRALLDHEGLPALYVTHDHDEAFAIASRVGVMRDGRIVQLGPPADVWRRPVDAWTASFLGFGPRFAATLTAGRITTPWGAGVAADPSHHHDGPVHVVVRPDAVQLDASGPVAATVTRVVFSGAFARVVLHAASGPELTVLVAPREAPRPGDATRVSFDSDGMLVYDDEAD